MDSFVVDYVDRLADQLLDPQKRVFLGYLSSALAPALAVGGSPLSVSLSFAAPPQRSANPCLGDSLS